VQALGLFPSVNNDSTFENSESFVGDQHLAMGFQVTMQPELHHELHVYLTLQAINVCALSSNHQMDVVHM
jgi:hypothetical protein